MGLGDAESRVRDLLTLIDGVHCDGDIPEFNIKLFAPGDEGKRGLFDADAREISLNSNLVRMEITCLHEIGHAIDFFGLDAGASSVNSSIDELVPWKEAVAKTRTYARLIAGSRSEKISLPGSYRNKEITPDAGIAEWFRTELLPWHEIWPRSYTQYIVSRTESLELSEQVEAWRGCEDFVLYTPLWEDGEFEGIGFEIDRLFEARKWK